LRRGRAERTHRNDPMSSDDPVPPPAEAASPGAPPAPLLPAAYESLLAQLAREVLRDRRSERRWRVFFRLAWLSAFVFIAWGLLAQHARVNAAAGPHTALVELRGEIAEDTEASAENIVAGLKSAFEESEAQAVVLRINSPGGSPVQAGIINDEIRR